MSILQNLRQRIGFTRNELIVLLFLALALLVGTAVRSLTPAGTEASIPAFDYRTSDSEYVALSNAAARLPEDAAPHGNGSRAKAKSLPAKEGININTASAEELTQLPGIGPALAARIVEYRVQKGRFSTLDELKNVKGIGPKKFEKLRPYIRLR